MCIFVNDLVTKRLIKFIRNLILLLGLSTLAACTVVGPDYQEPVVELLQDWQPSAYGHASGQKYHEENDQIDSRFWCYLFNDPILNQLIETAKRENHSLRIAGLRIF